jgi:hypothetical protein
VIKRRFSGAVTGVDGDRFVVSDAVWEKLASVLPGKVWIPIQGGQVFQPDGGHPTDLMAATLPI